MNRDSHEQDNAPATKGDLKQLEQSTKADLKIIKADIEQLRLSTKADTDILKSDMNVLKSDVKNLEQKLIQETKKISFENARQGVKIDKFRDEIMSALREFKSELLSVFELSVVKGRWYEQKAVTHGDMLTSHDDKLSNHETRIASLEQK